MDRLLAEEKIDPNEYDTKFEEIRKSVYKAELDSSVRFTEKGRQYSEAYINKYGRDLNIAYLKDLGYNDQTAKELAERVDKANKRLLNGM